ncbi:MAG: O-antigen ligase family protein [Fibromonadaceae bacterium]|nr:O-antigen ligase family protein [Fibromonadaceae bacterium]
MILNKQHAAVLMVVLASSQMHAQSQNVIHAILFVAVLHFFYVFLSTRQNKSFLLILLLPIAYILAIFFIQPYKINIYHYLGYLTALFILAWVMLLEWDSKKIAYFLTAYGSYLILTGFLEKALTNAIRVGQAALTVATAYAVVLVVTWTIWIIIVFLSKMHSKKTILLGTFLVFLAIIFSGTRMGLLGIFFGLGLCTLSAVFIESKKFSIIKTVAYSLGIIIALSLLSVIVWNLLPNDLLIKKTFSSLIAGKLDASNMGRVLMWYYAINVFEQNMLLGIGAGNFPEKYKLFLQSMNVYENVGINTHAHNIFLVVLSEHGIIGFLTLGTFVFLCLLQPFLYFLKNRQSPVFYALFSGFIVIAILGLVDAIPMHMPTTGFAAWFLGTCASFGTRRV